MVDLIKTGIGITKTIRNVNRMKEIALVFAKNGFDEFAATGVASQIPNFVIPKSKRSIKDELNEQLLTVDNTDIKLPDVPKTKLEIPVTETKKQAEERDLRELESLMI